jgi:hypothetical protein
MPATGTPFCTITVSAGDSSPIPAPAITHANFTHVELLAQPAEARVSILLYDALDFSTDRDDGGGQTRESLSRVASASAAVTGVDPARTETHVALCDYPLAGCVWPRQSRRLRARRPYKIRARGLV